MFNYNYLGMNVLLPLDTKFHQYYDLCQDLKKYIHPLQYKGSNKQNIY